MIASAPLIALALLIFSAVCAFWIWMLVECLTKESDTGNAKVTWLLVILFAQIIGAVIYYFARRPQRYAELGR